MEDTRPPLAAGMFFDRPREGAPEFVKGKLSVKVADAIPMLNQYANEKGYVKFDLLQSKDGSKLYLTVNTWKPKTETQQAPAHVPANPAYPTEEIRPEDIGF
jgi:hypothetical protein